MPDRPRRRWDLVDPFTVPHVTPRVASLLVGPGRPPTGREASPPTSARTRFCSARPRRSPTRSRRWRTPASPRSSSISTLGWSLTPKVKEEMHRFMTEVAPAFAGAHRRPW